MQKAFGFLSDESLLFHPVTNMNLEEKALLIAGVGAGLAFPPAELSSSLHLFSIIRNLSSR